MNLTYKKDLQARKNFESITIRISSPESILNKSRGEVLKPETINYRTYKPEKDGLFCEKIFGPVKDWECHCGKYKRIRYKGIVCDRCGVEVTQKKVRRERMGHITLAVPVVHIWYLKSIPSKLGHLLGISATKLEQIIYYESYIVIQPGKVKINIGNKERALQVNEIIDEETYFELSTKQNNDSEEEIAEEDRFIAKTGAEAIDEILSKINIPELLKELQDRLKKTKSKTEQTAIVKRLKIVKAFAHNEDESDVLHLNRPENMVLKVLPVIPPELRPLVPLEGGRFAASDLNDLYRRVIIRNNRLKQLISIKAPDVILRNEKRMLQEAVDSLFDNKRRRTAVRSGTRRPLKSLSDMLNGKEGRFRQNLLGKRVDYSGRSVIVVGPELQLHQCGIPKLMATELFKPHIIHELLLREYAANPKIAKSMVEQRSPEVMNILEYVVKDHPVLLNRAPTLHRLGIQAFQPILVDGKAIRLHPLVCSAFNADFDGDQMAVHVPLSYEAIVEAKMLMMANDNILHPASGNPITIPTQDMVLGIYYITGMRPGQKGEGTIFSSIDEAIFAYDNERIEIQAKVKLYYNKKIIDTTMGRIIFNNIMPEELPYYNELITKKKLEHIISESIVTAGKRKTVKVLDKLKDLGFLYATKSGVSIALDDIRIPDDKFNIIEKTQKIVDDINEKRNQGVITENERYNKVIDAWSKTTDEVQASMDSKLRKDDDGFNSVFIMSDSGARGSKDQIKQLAGMRGLMNKPQKAMSGGIGEIIETPIISNFKEGLSVLEYFISTHGARKGLSDTALKTADAGYLTRRLVDVAQDVVIREVDCGTINGINIKRLTEGNSEIESLYERINGRVVLDDVIDPVTDEVFAEADELIDENIARKIDASNIESVRIRSVLTCEAKEGVCSKCYGKNLATNNLVNIGEAVGIMAAQSIGEPGTQLTLRTFHIGGIGSKRIEESHQQGRHDGTVRYSNNLNISKGKLNIALTRNGKIAIVDSNNRELILHSVPQGAKVNVKDGEKITAKTILYNWDAYNDNIVSRYEGYVKYIDFIENVTFAEVSDSIGHKEWQIIASKDRDKTARIDIVDENGQAIGKPINMPERASIIVSDGDYVVQGQTLAKQSKESAKSTDITGGLPRVSELFEARNPKNEAIVSEVDGYVKFDKLTRGIQTLRVKNEINEVYTYRIPPGKHILVHNDDYVHAGESLCDGAIPPRKILEINGIFEVQKYLLNEIQHVYRLQGVSINDKHIEVIVRQMLQKVVINDPGDTGLLNGDRINRQEVLRINEDMTNKVIIVESGDTDLIEGKLYSFNDVKKINSDKSKKAKYEDVKPATFDNLLLGITRASLNTESFISAASFQETTRVLSDAAVMGKVDNLKGLKENIIMGRLIPAGTGQKKNSNIYLKEKEVYSNEEEVVTKIDNGSEKN